MDFASFLFGTLMGFAFGALVVGEIWAKKDGAENKFYMECDVDGCDFKVSGNNSDYVSRIDSSHQEQHIALGDIR